MVAVSSPLDKVLDGVTDSAPPERKNFRQRIKVTCKIPSNVWLYVRVDWGNYVGGLAMLRQKHFDTRTRCFCGFDKDELIFVRNYHVRAR